MSSYVTLVGAEEVSRAASTMSSAASQMNDAARNMDDALTRHTRFMDDWLQRYEEVLNTRLGELSDTLHNDRQARS